MSIETTLCQETLAARTAKEKNFQATKHFVIRLALYDTANGRSSFIQFIDKRRYTRYVLTLFTLQSGALICTAQVNGPYTQGDLHANKLFFLFDV